MTTKIALIGLCAFALLLDTGCSTTKTSTKSAATTGDGKTTSTAAPSNDNLTSDNNQKLPPVAEAPRRPTWGSNISPYFR